MNEGFSWMQLGTVAGVAAAVTTLTQIIKRYAPRVDPKWIALGLAALISLVHMAAYLDVTVETVVLTLLNAVVAAGAAIGGYEGIVSPMTHMAGKGEAKNEGD